jgi:DNA-binding MarR family transcriptional regulator
VPGITGLIDRLEQAGLVRRQRCDEDRRVIFVAITDKATQLVNRLDEPVLNLHQTLMARLSKTELKELSRLLERVRESLSTAE